MLWRCHCFGLCVPVLGWRAQQFLLPCSTAILLAVPWHHLKGWGLHLSTCIFHWRLVHTRNQNLENTYFMSFGIPGQANGAAGCFPMLPDPLAELQILFILITSCKVQDYVDIIGRSKGSGTLARWPSQDAGHSSRLNILDYFLPLF